jgi:hypothetical protein
MIENFFEESLLKRELNGKKFNYCDDKFDHNIEYEKVYFAEHVVRKK